MDYSPLGSSVHRLVRARILEWVAVLQSVSSATPALQADSLPLGKQGSPYMHTHTCTHIYIYTESFSDFFPLQIITKY